jgi:hypothetical protein
MITTPKFVTKITHFFVAKRKNSEKIFVLKQEF